MNHFSDRLLDSIRKAKTAIQTKDLTDRENLIGALKFLYAACMASERLLLEAAESARSEFFNDNALAVYYDLHFEEEKGEIGILKEDLESAGVVLDQTDLDPIAIAMVGSQYYLLKHLHPVCLLGYMAVQEADPTPIEFIEKLESIHGENVLRFCRMHAIRDQEHKKDVLSLIDSLPEDQQNMVLASAKNTLAWLKMRFNNG